MSFVRKPSGTSGTRTMNPACPSFACEVVYAGQDNLPIREVSFVLRKCGTHSAPPAPGLCGSLLEVLSNGKAPASFNDETQCVWSTRRDVPPGRMDCVSTPNDAGASPFEGELAEGPKSPPPLPVRPIAETPLGFQFQQI